MNLNPEKTPHHFIHNDETCIYLPIPVYPYIRPNMGTQFLLHILFSLGRFSTELDLILQDSLRSSLFYTKLIGINNDQESLQHHSNSIFTKFDEEQLISFPNSRLLIDNWIICTGELFNDVIKENIIPIIEMLAVQLTT